MAPLTVSNYLGLLQEDPDNQQAVDGLRTAISNGESPGESPVRLLEMARMQHEQRGELRAAAWLIELEAPLISDDPDLEAALFKELGRIRHEELLDDEGAKGAYLRALALRPNDHEVQEAIEQVDQAASNWKEIARRFVEEADDASDASLKTSLLTRAAALIWQYKKRGRDKEVDKLFTRALDADPASTRAARLFAETLRVRERWDELASVLVAAADHARNRDEKLQLYLRAGRVFARRLGDRDRAGSCYERVLDFSPGHEESLRFLVEYFTEREEWDHLVALYEDALRSRQKIESEQGILLQIGMVHWRIRSSPDQAEPYFNRLRKIDPAHPGMLAFYREHLGHKDDARLLTILGDAQRVAKDSSQKLALAIEVAHAAQVDDSTVERAIDAWKAVQRLDGTNAEAQIALRDLYRRGEKWNALVELIKDGDRRAPRIGDGAKGGAAARDGADLPRSALARRDGDQHLQRDPPPRPERRRGARSARSHVRGDGPVERSHPGPHPAGRQRDQQGQARRAIRARRGSLDRALRQLQPGDSPTRRGRDDRPREPPRPLAAQGDLREEARVGLALRRAAQGGGSRRAIPPRGSPTRSSSPSSQASAFTGTRTRSLSGGKSSSSRPRRRALSTRSSVSRSARRIGRRWRRSSSAASPPRRTTLDASASSLA